MQPHLREGGIYKDERGSLSFVNDFNLADIKRMYITSNANTQIIRAWMSHQIESRWFFCTNGGFKVNLVRVLDFEKGIAADEEESFQLEADRPQILYVPPGYASGFRATKEKSKLLILSDYAMNEVDDNYKFSQETFKTWTE